VLTWTHAIGPSVNVTLYQATYASGACGAYTGSSLTAATGHTVTGLTSGNAYCWYITQWNSTGQSSASNVLTDVQTANDPAAATGLTVSKVSGSTTSLLASWTIPAKDTGIVNETLYLTAGGSCIGAPTTTSLGVTQSFQPSGLTANTLYGVTVQLWNATGASPQTSCVTATTYAVPSAPSGLGVTSEGTTFVNLAWTNPSAAGVTIVNDTIDEGTSCGTWTTLISTGGAASAFNVTPLAPYTSYCFAIGAWDGGAEGSLSSTQSVTTLTVVPAAPTGLSASPLSGTSIALSWTSPTISSGNLLNDTVYYGTNCGALSSKASTGASVQSYTVTGLSPSTPYCFDVTAWTQAGQGAASSTATATTNGPAPSAPTSLVYVSASRTSITISWTQPSGTLFNDTVYWKAGSSCSTGAAGISASVASTYTVGSLTAGGEYCFEVTAWSNGGQSADSSAVTGFTQGATPPAPVSLLVFSIGQTWANVEWVNPTGYTLFNDTVYWKATSCGPSWPNSYSAGAVTASHNITGLTPGQSYCVEVTAWDAESPYSEPLFLNTTASVPSLGGPCPEGCVGNWLPSTPAEESHTLTIVGLCAVALVILTGTLLVLGMRRETRSSGRRRGR
jgi:Fibronectin type III domain